MESTFRFKFGIVSVILVALAFASISESYKISDENPYRQRRVLDAKGNYILVWEYRPEKKDIIFNVTVKQCEGFVGLGLAKRESMLNADFFVGGVHPDGKAYSKDMHTKGNRTLIEDPQQDWKLLAASEEKGVTCLSFSRAINTCDENDIEITENRIVILWAYGENDTLGYHYHNRGFINAYLLDPNLAPELDSSGNIVTDEASHEHEHPSVELWKLRRKSRLEQKPTSYFCSIHKGLKLPRKHHAVGFKIYLENEIARKHSHHFVVYRCKAPAGVDPKAMFEPFVDYPGEECHFNENRRLPINFCFEMLYVWGIGGEAYFLNENVGLNVGEDSDEYLMFETHFDNQDMRASVDFEVGVDIYLTPELRPRDGRMLVVGYDIPGSLAAFPPNSVNFNFIGQCDPECTKWMFPEEGVKISAVFLHAHNSGRKLRLRHFRNNRELPNVISDDNWNPMYQQYRNLPRDVTVLPGDHLVMQCELDNSLANNGTTVAGFGTKQEMCVAFITTDTNISRDRCTSEYPAYRLLAHMGVNNVTWNAYLQDRIVTHPRSLRGLTLGEVGDKYVDWTSQKRKHLEKDMMYSDHIMNCWDVGVPQVEDILAAADAGEEGNSIKKRPPGPGPKTSGSRNQERGWTPTLSYTGIGFSRPDNDLGLQKEVRQAAQQVRNQGIRSIAQMDDDGAIIMRAATGNPNYLERMPPTGLAGRVPPTARFPENAQKPKKTSKDKCEEKKKKLLDAPLSFLKLSDLQQLANPISGDSYSSLPMLSYNLRK